MGQFFNADGSVLLEGIWADDKLIRKERVYRIEPPQEETDEFKGAKTAEDYETFIDKYPYSLKVPQAIAIKNSLIAALEAKITNDLFQTIQMSNDPKLMQEFLDKYLSRKLLNRNTYLIIK